MTPLAGGAGSASRTLTSQAPNVLVGVLHGQLFSARRYEQGRLSIDVEVTFLARRGALSCMR